MCHNTVIKIWAPRLGLFRYFEAAVKASVRDGYTFKGYPIHFAHCSERRMFSALLQSRTSKDILETVGQVPPLLPSTVTL